MTIGSVKGGVQVRETVEALIASVRLLTAERRPVLVEVHTGVGPRNARTSYTLLCTWNRYIRDNYIVSSHLAESDLTEVTQNYRQQYM